VEIEVNKVNTWRSKCKNVFILTVS